MTIMQAMNEKGPIEVQSFEEKHKELKARPTEEVEQFEPVPSDPSKKLNIDSVVS